MVKKEIKGEIKRYNEKNENDNMTYQNFWDAEKVVIRGKFIHCRSISRNKRNSKSHLQKLEKKKSNPKSTEERK